MQDFHGSLNIFKLWFCYFLLEKHYLFYYWHYVPTYYVPWYSRTYNNPAPCLSQRWNIGSHDFHTEFNSHQLCDHTPTASTRYVTSLTSSSSPYFNLVTNPPDEAMTKPSHATEGNLNSTLMQTEANFLQTYQHTLSPSVRRPWLWSAQFSNLNLLMPQSECKWSLQLDSSQTAGGANLSCRQPASLYKVPASIGFHIFFASSSLSSASSMFTSTFPTMAPEVLYVLGVCLWVRERIDHLPLHKSQYPGIDSWLARWSPCCCVLLGPTCYPQGSMVPCNKAFHYYTIKLQQLGDWSISWFIVTELTFN